MQCLNSKTLPKKTFAIVRFSGMEKKTLFDKRHSLAIVMHPFVFYSEFLKTSNLYCNNTSRVVFNPSRRLTGPRHFRFDCQTVRRR